MRMGIMSVGQNILPPLFQIYSGYDDINFMYLEMILTFGNKYFFDMTIYLYINDKKLIAYFVLKVMFENQLSLFKWY